MNPVDLFGPGLLSGVDVQFPAADLADPLGFREQPPAAGRASCACLRTVMSRMLPMIPAAPVRPSRLIRAVMEQAIIEPSRFLSVIS